MTIAVVVVVAVVLVLVVGLLIFRLMKKAQTAVPGVSDSARPSGEHVVGLDEQGDQIVGAQEPEPAPRDESAFESVLRTEIDARGMEQPRADDEG